MLRIGPALTQKRLRIGPVLTQKKAADRPGADTEKATDRPGVDTEEGRGRIAQASGVGLRAKGEGIFAAMKAAAPTGMM